MAHISTLNITFYRIGYREHFISVKKIVQALSEFGWALEDGSQIHLLPLGDKGNYNWTILPASEKESALDILSKKEAVGEVPGVDLYWGETGVSVLFSYEKRIVSFIFSINRRSLEEWQNFTDVNWYLQRIIPALTAKGIGIERIEFIENI